MSAINSLNRSGIYALFSGIFAGLLFGPLTGVFLKPLADAFSMLLQMAVFPYICLSLIWGLASISSKSFIRILKIGLPFILGIWFLSYFFIYFISQMIPDPDPPLILAKTFLTTETIVRSFIDYLIPNSLFYSLSANSLVAGITFSLLFGAGLMKIEKKEYLIQYLERSLEILEKLFSCLRVIAPVGAFLYIAIAFGTVRLEEVVSLEFYIINRAIFSVFFVFAILPLIIINCTNFSLRQVFKAFWQISFLPFLTASPALAVPFLVLYCRSEEENIKRNNFQIFLPIAYCLGQIGSTVVFSIATYLSFYYRFPLTLFEKIFMSFLFAPISIGDPTTMFSTSFLIDQFHLPSNVVQTLSAAGLVMHHFLVLMSVTGVITIIFFLQFQTSNAVQVHWKKLTVFLSAFTVLFIFGVFAIKPFLRLDNYYEGFYQNLTISDVIKDPVKIKILQPGEFGTPRDPMRTSLGQILETGVLKVGILTTEIPYCYINDKNELAGYDIAYAYQMARDLDCSLEFVPVNLNEMAQELESGLYDVGMAAFLMTENRFTKMGFSQPYRIENNVLIVPRAKKDKYMKLEDFQYTNFRIASGEAYIEADRKYFPNAQIFSVETLQPLINHDVDACIWSRSSAYVWCLSHPEFIVIDYGADLGKTYLGYPIREDAFNFTAFLTNWLQLKEQTGFKRAMEQYWIEGEPPSKGTPRWSIMSNVFHLWNLDNDQSIER